MTWSEHQEVYPFFVSIPEHTALAIQLFSKEFPSFSEAIVLVGHQEALM